jgi:predicted nucleic acid-binding protein
VRHFSQKVFPFVEISETIVACRDPKDDQYLALAINGGAECIVTGDEDLLVLHPFRSIPILTARSFLEKVLSVGRSGSWRRLKVKPVAELAVGEDGFRVGLEQPTEVSHGTGT